MAIQLKNSIVLFEVRQTEMTFTTAH